MSKAARIRISKVTLKPGFRCPGKASFKIVSEGGQRRFIEAYFEKAGLILNTVTRQSQEIWVRRPEPA